MALKRHKLVTFLAAAVGLAAWTSSAHAQQAQTTEVSIPKFDPSVPGDRFFGVPSPYSAGELTFHANALLDYARDPFVLVHKTGDTTEPVDSIVSDQMFVHIAANFSIINHFAINADMPFAVLSQGNHPSGGDFAFTEPSGAAVGDLRLGLRATLFGEYFDAFQLGLGGYVWVPTGGSDSYVSDGTVHGQPQLLVGGRADMFIYSIMLGPTLRAETDVGGAQLGHQFNWGAGAGVLVLDDRSLQLGLETSGGVDMQNPAGVSTNSELLAGVKWRFVDFLEAGIAGGPGLTRGIGTPAGRFVFQFAYTPEMEQAKPDRDKDGIFDDVDACPDVPGVKTDDPKTNGCPPVELDTDKDTILDKVDACPTVPGVASEDPKKNGCPLPKDRDNDGIIDDLDACPDDPGKPSDDPKMNGCPDKDGDGVFDKEDACIDIPGIRTSDPKTNGCPGDTDGDGFRDDQDACPQEKGVDDKDPAKRGCPKLVRVTDKEVIILEQVQFDTGKSTIKPVSNALLDSVAEVLKEHPELTGLEVQGHTDNRGSAALNAKLSDDRAKAVKDALIKRGIEAGRLTSKGYGPDVPIGDNKTDEGRQKNRRVQFVITSKKERAPKP